MLRYLTILLTLLTLTSCRSTTTDEFTRYYEDGRAKPNVVIAPIIDTTPSDYNWSLADEFKDLILKRVAHHGNLFVQNEDTTYIPSSENPFGQDISWVKDEFAPHEFVVFLELINHEFVSVKKQSDMSDSSKALNTSIRVRVIDIRYAEPKIVLQEVVNDSYYIPKNILHPNYNITVWGTDNYTGSPMALAHAKITKDLVMRLNDYILLAKSR